MLDKKNPKVKKDEVKKEGVEAFMETILNVLEEQNQRITKIQSTVNLQLGNIKSKIKKAEEQPKEPVELAVIDGGIPEGIKDAVQESLGKTVSIKLENSKDSPHYTIRLTIPSIMSKSDIQPDVRSKTVSVAAGLPAIKEWLKLVKANIYNSFQKEGESVPVFE